jgi:hypothetical protein
MCNYIRFFISWWTWTRWLYMFKLIHLESICTNINYQNFILSSTHYSRIYVAMAAHSVYHYASGQLLPRFRLLYVSHALKLRNQVCCNIRTARIIVKFHSKKARILLVASISGQLFSNWSTSLEDVPWDPAANHHLVYVQFREIQLSKLLTMNMPRSWLWTWVALLVP